MDALNRRWGLISISDQVVSELKSSDPVATKEICYRALTTEFVLNLVTAGLSRLLPYICVLPVTSLLLTKPDSFRRRFEKSCKHESAVSCSVWPYAGSVLFVSWRTPACRLAGIFFVEWVGHLLWIRGGHSRFIRTRSDLQGQFERSIRLRALSSLDFSRSWGRTATDILF